MKNRSSTPVDVLNSSFENRCPKSATWPVS